MWLTLLLAFSASADKLTIQASDAEEIELDCGSGATVYKPPVLMDPAPASCLVTMWKPVSNVPQKGKVTCSTSGCALEGDADLLEISAPLPISKVALDCAGSVLVYDLVDSKVVIEAPGECSASIGAAVGSVPPGVWACTLAGCTSDAHSRTVTAKIAAGSPTEASLSCGDDTMRKAAVAGGAVTFTDVPHENCTLTFTGGGPPAKVRPIKWGTHSCEISGQTAVCRPE